MWKKYFSSILLRYFSILKKSKLPCTFFKQYFFLLAQQLHIPLCISKCWVKRYNYFMLNSLLCNFKRRFLVSLTSDSNQQKTSLQRRLQTQILHRPFTAEAPPIGKIRPLSKIAVTFEPVMQFGCPSRFRIDLDSNIV